ncbi:MAG: DUF4199 domain-containing protein [Salibacteraceae bacterium]
MWKTYVIYGTISGLICGGLFFVVNPMDFTAEDMARGQVLGYASMFIAFSSIFIAVHKLRNATLPESLPFRKALLPGLVITLIASLVYVVMWEVYMAYSPGNFAEQYTEYLVGQKIDEGYSATEAREMLTDQIEMMETYNSNTPFRMMMSFLEIFPVGLLFSLVAALLYSFVFRTKPSERNEN